MLLIFSCFFVFCLFLVNYFFVKPANSRMRAKASFSIIGLVAFPKALEAEPKDSLK